MAINTTLKKNYQDLYLVSFNKATEYGSADTYSEPKKYTMNVITAPSYTDIQLFGTEAQNRIRVVDDRNIISQFKIGDRVYFNKVLPSTHNELQNNKADANYEVDIEPLYALNIGTLRLKKLNGR